MLRRLSIALFLVILGAPTITCAVPISTAGNYLGGGSVYSNFGGSTGFQFAPTVDLYVTALGIYDHGADGLDSAHKVGIFHAGDSSLLGSVSVGAGTSETFVPGTVDGTWFASTPVFKLTGGTSYYILGDNWETEQYAFGTGAVLYAPEIVWNGYVDGSSNSIFSAPVFFSGLPGNLGPNFQYSTTPIPEPSTWLLLFTGAAGWVFTVWRKNRKHCQEAT